jgi:hypothetical protein
MNEERRGEEARRILESDIYKEAYAQVEANIVARLAQADTKAEDAETLRQLLIALRKVRIYMEQVLNTGCRSRIYCGDGRKAQPRP